jgi:hypothetical protein
MTRMNECTMAKKKSRIDVELEKMQSSQMRRKNRDVTIDLVPRPFCRFAIVSETLQMNPLRVVCLVTCRHTGGDLHTPTSHVSTLF